MVELANTPYVQAEGLLFPLVAEADAEPTADHDVTPASGNDALSDSKTPPARPLARRLAQSLSARTVHSNTGAQKTPPSIALRQLRDRRVLVVDDFRPNLDLAMAEIGPHVGEVVVSSHPTAALGELRLAHKGLRPFDALILDLRMPDMNGDAFLRLIAEEGLLLPTVICSGEHARELQASIFPQLEAARGTVLDARLEELAGLEARFTELTTGASIDAWRTAMVRLTDGVPITFVPKGSPCGRLLAALARVIVTGTETNWPAFQKVVAQFRPLFKVSSPLTEYVEFLAELMSFYFKLAHEIVSRVEEKLPWLGEVDAWKKLKLIKLHEGSSRYSFEAFMEGEHGGQEEHKSKGAARRHRAINLLYLERSISILLATNPRFATELKASGLEAFVMDSLSRLVGLFKILHLKMGSVEKPEQTDANIALKALARTLGAEYIEPREKEYLVRGPSDLLLAVVEQAVMNASQWGAGKGLTPKLYLRRRSVAEIDEKSGRYFQEKHGLSGDSKIIEVLVTDKGPGIPAKNLQRIFEPGFTTREGGTGFGLAFVAANIEKLHGRVCVKSKLGRGTRVYFYFLPA